MRKTQGILYRIGKIINFVWLGLYALAFVIYSILLIVHIVNDVPFGGDISGMVTMFIFCGFTIALIILSGKFSEEALKAPVNGLAPIIILMVFGVLSTNILFTVGGVFGIIGAAQENNAKEKEEKKESVDEVK